MFIWYNLGTSGKTIYFTVLEQESHNDMMIAAESDHSLTDSEGLASQYKRLVRLEK